MHRDTPMPATPHASGTRRRVLVAFAAVALVAACGSPAPSTDAEAGTSLPDAASNTDATAPAPDASHPAPDADASTPPPDGPPPMPTHVAQLAMSRGDQDLMGRPTTTCARMMDGTVQCWGANNHGQVGDGTMTDRATPTVVNGLTDVVELAAGFLHFCARSMDGTVRCWGFNESGQLGDGTTTDRATPVVAAGLTNVAELAPGNDHSCARLMDGTVRCWGANDTAELGGNAPDTCTARSDGSTYPCALMPVEVTGLTNVVELGSASGYSCARLMDGTVRCWGYNEFGQLGAISGERCSLDSTMSWPCSHTPLAVMELSNVVQLAVGAFHACARLMDGTVRCWGGNAGGQCGDGTSVNRTTPAQVLGLSGTVAELARGAYHTCARLTDGTARCWGLDLHGAFPVTSPMFCNGGGSAPNLPCSRWATPAVGLTGVAELAAGFDATCARDTANVVRCVGGNSHGQLGDGTMMDRTSPVPVVGLP